MINCAKVKGSTRTKHVLLIKGHCMVGLGIKISGSNMAIVVCMADASCSWELA